MFQDIFLFFIVGVLVFIINTNNKTTQSALLQCVGFFLIIALLTMFNSNELIGTYILIIYVGAMSVVFSMAAALLIPHEKYKALGDGTAEGIERWVLSFGLFVSVLKAWSEFKTIYVRFGTQSPFTSKISDNGAVDFVHYIEKGRLLGDSIDILELSRGISHFSGLYLVCGILLLLGLCCVLSVLGMASLGGLSKENRTNPKGSNGVE